MGFIDALIKFHVELAQIEKEIYTSLSFQLVKHPEESLENICAKALCYLFEYEERLEISKDFTDEKSPALWEVDFSGEIAKQVEIGSPSAYRIKRLQKQSSVETSVYFFDDEQIERFAHSMKGSRQNWVSKFRAYQFEPVGFNALVEQVAERNRISATVSEERVYLQFSDETLIEIQREAVDLWSAFQEMLLLSEANG